VLKTAGDLSRDFNLSSELKESETIMKTPIDTLNYWDSLDWNFEWYQLVG